MKNKIKNEKVEENNQTKGLQVNNFKTKIRFVHLLHKHQLIKYEFTRGHFTGRVIVYDPLSDVPPPGKVFWIDPFRVLATCFTLAYYVSLQQLIPIILPVELTTRICNTLP